MNPAITTKTLALEVALARVAQRRDMSVWTTNDRGLLVPISSIEVHHMQDSEGSTPYLFLKRGD